MHCALCTVLLLHLGRFLARVPCSISIFNIGNFKVKEKSDRDREARSEKREEQKSEVWSRAPSLAIVTTGLFFVSLCVCAGVVVTLRATAALVTILLYTTYNIQQSQSPAFFKGHEQARVSSTFP